MAAKRIKSELVADFGRSSLLYHPDKAHRRLQDFVCNNYNSNGILTHPKFRYAIPFHKNSTELCKDTERLHAKFTLGNTGKGDEIKPLKFYYHLKTGIDIEPLHHTSSPLFKFLL